MDASNVVSGHKNLAILDMNSFMITNRQPEMLIYEPLFADPTTARPTGQAGWFSLVADRVGPDHGDRLPVPHDVMAAPTRTRRLAGGRPAKPKPAECAECGATECGTPRVPVCCGACGH